MLACIHAGKPSTPRGSKRAQPGCRLQGALPSGTPEHPCQSGCGTLATQPSVSYPFAVTAQPLYQTWEPARCPSSSIRKAKAGLATLPIGSSPLCLFSFCPQRTWETGHLPSDHNYLLQTLGQPSFHLALFGLNPPPLPHPFHHPNCPLDNMLGCGILGFSESWLATQSPL